MVYLQEIIVLEGYTMVEFIGNYFVKRKGAEANQLKERQIYGTVCSVIGIMLNVCLHREIFCQ